MESIFFIFLLLLKLRISLTRRLSPFAYLRKKYGFATLKLYRKLENLRRRLVKAEQDLEFLQLCQLNNVFPNFIKFKLYKDSLYNSDFYRSACADLLNLEIRSKEVTIKKLQDDILPFSDSLKLILSYLDMICIRSFLLSNLKVYLKGIQAVHDRKLFKLHIVKPNMFNPNKVIFNFSNYILSHREKFLLSLDTSGVVAFVGSTHFSQGKWIGVVLDTPKGKNNGTVQGKSYFQCEDGYGLFVRASQLTIDFGDDEEEEESFDGVKSSLPVNFTPPTISEKPKSSIKRKIEPTSLRRKPIGNQVPQKPDRLRLPTYGRLSLSAFGSGNSLQSPTDFSSASGVPRTPSFTSMQTPSLTKTPSQLSIKSSSSKTDLSKSLSSSQTNIPKTDSNGNLDSPVSRYPSSNFRKPIVSNYKYGSAKKNTPHTKLPLGSTPKMNTPRSGKEERTPVNESPRQEMKKMSSFVEDLGVNRGAVLGIKSPSLRSLSSECSSLAPENYAVESATAESLLESPSSQVFIQTGFVETITPHYTPGAPSLAMQTLEEKANAIHAHQEMENLKAEIKDLTEKLETLRIKRSQDKDKLKEGEKLKLQVEQLLEFKARIMDSQAALQKDLQKAKQDAKEAIEAKERHIEETEELMENVEMLTLDKEMAEEKAEALQLEMEQMKEKIEELTLDLEILKAEENEDSPRLEGKTSTVQVKQLEQQNTRLHETLIKMRDMAARDKHELQKVIKELEGKKSEILELTRSKEKYAGQVSELEEVISDLQEQVDAALGAEDMVETLTDRNLNLEERVTELLETVSDLEAINDMNDQLQEDTRDLELELREELDLANAKVREIIKDKEASNEVIVDQDLTIKKFRDLVQKMQEQNLELRHSLEKETNKPVGTPSEIIDFKKMFTETKAHGKAIDLELRRLEVQQANQHLNYLQQYLPATFLNRGGDHDAVLMLLLLPRIVMKSEIIINGLREKYEPPEAITRGTVLKSHTVDQYSFSSRMLQMLFMLQALLKQYHHVLKSCSVELFLKMGTFYPEMAAQERNLDLYIDLLRNDQLDETVPGENLEKTVTYFQTVYPNHLCGEKLDQSLYLWDVAQVINAGAEAISTESARIESLLPPNEGSSEVTQLLTFLKSSCQEITNYVKRIKRRMPQDGSAGPVSYPDEVQDTLTKSMSNMYNATRAMRLIAKTCMLQTTLIGDIDGGIPSDKVKEFVHQATDLIYGSEDQGPESLKMSLNRTQEDIFKIADTVEKGEYDFDGTQEREAIPPVSLRAEAVKSEMKDTEHLKYKLETKEQDIKELKLTLKQKNEEFSQMTVRRDMAEKKLSTATRDADIIIEKLQRKLDDTLMALRRKEKEFEETMDQLQKDIESLEFEKGELREKLKTLNKKTLYDALSKTSPMSIGGMSPSSPTTPSSGINIGATGPSASMVVMDSPLLLQQIADLKQALSHSSNLKYSAIHSDMQQKLASLRPLKYPLQNLKLKQGEEKRDLDKDEIAAKVAKKESAERVNDLTRLTSKLQKELRELITGVQVVDLTKRHPGTVPPTMSGTPMQHLISHQNKIFNLRKRISSLQDEITRLLSEKEPGGCIKTHFSTFPTSQMLKATSENELVKIGKVTVLGSSNGPQEVVPMILQPEHLKALHLRLLN